jgi:hypothetical protein
MKNPARRLGKQLDRLPARNLSLPPNLPSLQNSILRLRISQTYV